MSRSSSTRTSRVIHRTSLKTVLASYSTEEADIFMQQRKNELAEIVGEDD